MTGPIYKLYLVKAKDAWYQLSQEERANVMARSEESLKKVGGKKIADCASLGSEPWEIFGIEEFPDIEAVQKHTQELQAMDHFRYAEGMSVLGVAWEK